MAGAAHRIPDPRGTYRIDHVDLRSFDIVAQELLEVSWVGDEVALAYAMYSFDPADFVFEKSPGIEGQLSDARRAERTQVTRQHQRGVPGAYDREARQVEVWIDGDITRPCTLNLETRNFIWRG